MRLLRDTLLALMLVGLLAGLVWHNRADSTQRATLNQVRDEVSRFRQQILLQATIGEVETSERGYPMRVDPAWFGDNLPRNTLLGPAHPWLEIAGTDQAEMRHPRQPLAGDDGLAQFWYNPATGALRARVPAGVSDQAALVMYNHINETGLDSLFGHSSQVRERSEDQ